MRPEVVETTCCVCMTSRRLFEAVSLVVVRVCLCVCGPVETHYSRLCHVLLRLFACQYCEGLSAATTDDAHDETLDALVGPDNGPLTAGLGPLLYVECCQTSSPPVGRLWNLSKTV